MVKHQKGRHVRSGNNNNKKKNRRKHKRFQKGYTNKKESKAARKRMLAAASLYESSGLFLLSFFADGRDLCCRTTKRPLETEKQEKHDESSEGRRADVNRNSEKKKQSEVRLFVVKIAVLTFFVFAPS
jgi:hypothetical protein